MFKLTDWELVCSYGKTGLIFARGSQRVLIDKITREIIIAYDIN